ncbi:TetR/AcrR family transcriptional regulator [Neobacillus terrae]|uniref:TetR/AcrR family transcriptional regulator n=1 Tax=Neobacillus terrae TaxID=3034837 RepID=UPI00140D4791|nr:TetR/AcrR family transcriptional regulator [Neobacillus terrae]NHM31598.1 TetR/AcrR family transcriptional regulator [Neobacillus terrae]
MSPRPKHSLDLTTILKEAANIADEYSYLEVTLATLAKKLGIRPPSLYNHFNGLADLREKLAVYGIERLYEELEEHTIGDPGENRILNVSKAYISFARKHPGLYEATLSAPNPENDEVQRAGSKIVELAVSMLQIYGLEGDTSLHAVRGLRSILHGFSMLEQKGGFGLALNTDKSLELIISSFLGGLERLGGENGGSD